MIVLESSAIYALCDARADVSFWMSKWLSEKLSRLHLYHLMVVLVAAYYKLPTSVPAV